MRMSRKFVVLWLIGIMLVAALPGAGRASAQNVVTAIAIDPVVGPAGTQVNYVGVGFTPGGRASVLLVRGLGLVVDRPTASSTGVVTGSFQMPARGQVPETTGARVDVFAIDEASGREAQPAPFRFTTGPALDYELPNGRFFTQTNAFPLGTRPEGYPVVDNGPLRDEVRFFSEFLRLGGVAGVGFPASRIFVLDGFVTQAFQKTIFQWRPELGRAFFLNVFDILHDRGFDDFLFVVRAVPRQLDPSFDAGKTAGQIVEDRLALLDANPAIRAAYFSVDDPVLRYGLPTSAVEDMGNVFVIRLQRAVIQQWKVDVPWARAGQVTVANGGDVFKELGQLPAFAVVPENPPTFSDRIVAYDPRRGETVTSPIRLRGEASAFEAVINFDLIGERGDIIAQGPIMTRAGGPVFGRFDTEQVFQTPREQRAILRLFERSAADGEIVPTSVVNISLTLRP